jgi:dimethylglycine dehydrogenase
MNLIYVSDARGRILTELSCIRLGEDNFVLITAATAQWHDGELIRSLCAGHCDSARDHNRA